MMMPFYRFGLNERSAIYGVLVGVVGVLLGLLVFGMRIFVLQFLQRTVFPRAIAGIESTFRQVRFGHIMRTILSSAIADSSQLIPIPSD